MVARQDETSTYHPAQLDWRAAGVQALGAQFSISISADEGEDFDNVGELADFIVSKVA